MKIRNWLKIVLAIVLPTTAVVAQPGEPSAAPLAGQPVASAPVDLPPGAAEVVRLSESGTSEEVILSYIHNSPSRFNLSADQILYLRDIGFSSQVISSMLNRDHELQSQAPGYTYDQKLYPPSNPAAVAPQPAPPVVPQEQPASPPPQTQAPAPEYVSTPPPDATYFYNDLAPYGTWVDLNGVGWCWQPRVVVVNHGWRPYCDDGHWVYSDAGWYWQSSYSWGWAPFHYGRWHLHPRCGWVWLPDRVWGPSWVVWRSEGDHCGWAPLPPHAVFEAGVGWRFNGVSVAVNFDFGLHPDHFTFIAMKDFNNHDLGHHRLAPTEVTRIYNHTTIINNYTVNNKTVVNQGIKVDRVAAATHTQIQRVAIRDVPAYSPGVARTQAPAKSGVVYRPQLVAPPAQRTPMVAQKVDDRHPVVQHAPVAVARTERPSSTTKSSGPAAPASRTPQPGNEKSYPHATPEKPANRPETSPRAATPANPASSTPSYSRPANAGGSRPEESRPSTPRTGVDSQNGQGRNTHAAPQSSSLQPYYPKSYHQASEIHALPPVNPRPDAQSGSQPTGGGSHSHKD